MFENISVRHILPFGALVAASLASSFACSSTTIITDAPPADTESGTADGGDTEVPDASDLDKETETDTEAGTDAGPEFEQVKLHTGTGKSCDKACADAAGTCTATCTFTYENDPPLLAGRAVYEYRVTDSKGWTDLYDSVELKTCSDVAPDKLTKYGDTYTPSKTYGPVSCCCMLPKLTEVEGDPSARKSCNELCKENGLVCDSARGGGYVGFKCSDGSAPFQDFSCSTTSPTKSNKGCPAVAFSCKCR